jgi:exopolyphosphatase / guanosine-5'-triphosphate,3'-diphosphate pyrophosphatase
VTRVAVVDLGTNSSRLLVADVDGSGVTELERRLTITRLGEAVDERRRLLPTAMARVRNALVDYRRTAEELGAERTLALATSSVRDAENGEAFLGEIEWSFGFTTRLLTGDEEALLTFRGVSAGRTLPADSVIVDVGGGSTELIGGDSDGIRFKASVDLGCVRLTERFLAGDPPTPGELRACSAHVREVLAETLPAGFAARGAIGVAGTVTTLATLSLGLAEEDPTLVHGHRISVDWIEAMLEELAALQVEQIAGLKGVHPDRAPVIVAGVVVVFEALRALGLDELEVSESDLMHGAALAAAELPAAVEGDAPPGAYTCC